MSKFKVGDRVISRSDHLATDLEGVVVGVEAFEKLSTLCMVEFPDVTFSINEDYLELVEAFGQTPDKPLETGPDCLYKGTIEHVPYYVTVVGEEEMVCGVSLVEVCDSYSEANGNEERYFVDPRDLEVLGSDHVPCMDETDYLLQGENGKRLLESIAQYKGTRPNGFVKYDTEKDDPTLVEPSFITGVAHILTLGARKYSPDNWKKCEEPVTYEKSLMRHIYAYLGGEKNDPETGKSHLLHAACNLMFLYWFDRGGRDEGLKR